MNLPDGMLREAYITQLSGNVLDSGGQPVPVFDLVPTNIRFPYIRVSQVSAVDDSCMDAFGTNTLMDINVFTQFDGDFGGTEVGERLATQITQRIIVGDQPEVLDLSPDFKCVLSILNNSPRTIPEHPKNGRRRYNTVVSIRHLIEEL